MTTQVETGTRLMQGGNATAYLQEVIEKERAVIEDVKKVLPFLKEGNIIAYLSKKLAGAEARLVALEAGFMPVEAGWLLNPDSKSKWDKDRIKTALKAMPDEVKEAWDKVKETGVFQSYGISGMRGADPVLVGRIRGTSFWIASWLHFPGGKSIGMIAGAVSR